MRKTTILAVMLSLVVGTVAFGRPLQKNAADEGLIHEIEMRGFNRAQLELTAAVRDDVGNTHLRYDQYVNGVRVFGAGVTAHRTRAGRLAGGRMFEGVVNGFEPRLTAEEAARAAIVAFAGNSDTDAVAELVIYPRGKFSAQLAYYVDVANTWGMEGAVNDPRREAIVIDAFSGAVIDRWNNLQTAATTGTGYGFYAGQVTNFPIDLTSGTYYMFDVPNNGKTTDFANKTCPPTGCRSIGTVYSSPDNVFGTTGAMSDRQSIGVDAHFFAERTLAYFSSTFGRNGIDNNNNKSLKWKFMVSRTHYGNNYNNAFWDGASMTYGDGDGTTYRPFDAVDVVGHEMMHGITERTSDLIYQNESGAANESFSDIFGTVVEFYTGTRTGFGGVSYPADYWIGEDLYYSNDPANPTKGIRNMQDPHIEGDPCHYSERYTGTSDNGGVHINSGIMNKVWYLLTNGGTNHKDTTGTTVTGIGMTASAAIAYDADTKYCTADDTYADVANAWMNAARGRYGAGSTQAVQTYNAWKACGVTPTQLP